MGQRNAHIGTRIAYWRRRRGGMSQTVLAGLAGVSQSYISKVESGLKTVERRQTLVALAAALQVSIADLTGSGGDPTDPHRERASAAVPQIRVVLAEIEEGERRAPVRGRAEMDAAVTELSGLRAEAKYAQMAVILPDLLADAAAYGGRCLARVGYETATCLKNLGYRDLALPAARVAILGAENADDPAWLGAARYFYTVALPIEAPGLSSRVANRALVDLQGKAGDPKARQMLGQLHLSASLTCAVDGRADDARSHLVEATTEAATLGDPDDGIGFNMLCFGPTNVGLWNMTVAAELGEQGRVVELARNLQPGRLKIADRHHSYWLNLGRALAYSGKADPQALVAFTNAERAAPVAFSANALARDAVGSMVHRARRRAVSEQLRVLARRVGIEISQG